MCVLPRHEAVIGCSPNPFLSSPAPYYFILIAAALACAAIGLLALSLRNNDALFMITVYEGCMVATGAISGNIVLDEWQGQTSSQLLAYSASVLIVLAGLALLVQGENAVALIGTEQQRLVDSVGVGAAMAKEWGGRARVWGTAACQDGARLTRLAWGEFTSNGVSSLRPAWEKALAQGAAAFTTVQQLWSDWRHKYQAPANSTPGRQG